ncbi:MAG: shikimate dehydrogenase [Xanthomonadales bacterium]|nr:shikimate dehydrogenase [Xanthomonadales bacterium]
MTVGSYAVFGDPIAQSKSPWIHRRFAESLGQPIDYQAIHAPAEQFEQLLADFRADGGVGANITAPLKGIAATLSTQLSEAAHRAQAVNCLRAGNDGSWYGDNTDGRGLIADLDRLQIGLDGARILMIGAGGAARGVLGPILQRHPERLVLANRTLATAQHVAGHLINLGNIEPVELSNLATLGQFDLLIHASAAGLGGTGVSLPPALVDPHSRAYDLSYGAAAGPFLQAAGEVGIAPEHRHDGLGMLVEQAAESYLIWRGQRPATDAVLAELRTLLDT